MWATLNRPWVNPFLKHHLFQPEITAIPTASSDVKEVGIVILLLHKFSVGGKIQRFLPCFTWWISSHEALLQLVDQLFSLNIFCWKMLQKYPPPCAKVKALRSAERYVVVRNRWASQVLAFLFPWFDPNGWRNGYPMLDKAWRISIPVPGAWWNIFMSLGKLKKHRWMKTRDVPPPPKKKSKKTCISSRHFALESL